MLTVHEREFLERFVTRVAGIDPRAVEKEFAQQGNWDNVFEHCLIEAARVCVFARLLRFDPELTKDLALAALLHDGHKKREVEAIRRDMEAGKSGRVASMAVAHEYAEELAKKGLSPRAIALMGFAGGMPEVIFTIDKILRTETLDDNSLASLVMHYVDAYTRNDEWAELSAQGVNDVDRRAQKNRENPNYKKIADEIEAIFAEHDFSSDPDPFNVMAVISHRIEDTLCRLIFERGGAQIDPLCLPEEIDKRIKEDLIL